MSPPDGPDSWDSSEPPRRSAVNPVPRPLTPRQARIEARLHTGDLLEGAADLLGEELHAERFEIQWRAAGLRRPGAIAHFTWPRLATRIGLGIEPSPAHALVDRLLGFERLLAEGRLQVTPVEWGILSFVIARGLDRLEARPGPFGPWDITLDRLGPDPFDPAGLGPIVTWRWRIRLGRANGSLRLWLPESLLALWLDDDPPSPDFDETSEWRAEAGSITLSRGLAKLRPGLLLLIDGAPLRGSAASPEGFIELIPDGPTASSRFRAFAMPGSHAARLTLQTPMTHEPRPDQAPAPVATSDPGSTANVSVTLTVSLGRINLPLTRLAIFKPGDVLELARDPQEPVELTARGQLVARGELVQVDTELGVRVTRVFL